MCCMLRWCNHSRVAMAMGLTESQSMMLGGAVVAVGMDHAVVQQRTRKTGDMGDGNADCCCIDRVRIATSAVVHLDCMATGADHMGSFQWDGSCKGCTRRCNGPAAHRPPSMGAVRSANSGH